MGTNSKPGEIIAPGDVFSVAFTRDGNHIVTGDRGGYTRRWTVEHGGKVGPLMQGDGRIVMGLSVSMDGRWIVTGSDGNKVVVWNASTHEKVLEITGHTGWVRGIDISSDSTRIATGSHDRTVQLFSITSGKRLLVPLQHTHIVLAVKFSPDDYRLATATHQRESVRVYDSHSGEMLFEVPVQIGPSHRTNSLAWSSDSKRLFCVVPGKITSLDLPTSSLTNWSIHNTHNDASIATNGKFIACSAGSAVSFWDPISHTQIGRILEHSGTVWAISLSIDGRHLACAHGPKVTLHKLNEILPQSYLTNPPLMKVSDEVLKSWTEGDLKNTETRLSDEILHASTPSYHAFANRALVRARTKQSPLATADANESLKVQPSPIGHIAMAVALLSQGDRDSSLCAFDLAFHECEPRETWLLLLLKAVLMTECGLQDDAVSRVEYLAKRSKDDVTYLCDQVLGGIHMKKGEYGRAMVYFDRVRAASPRNQNCPPLQTISLIFGWEFDRLDISSMQRLYETVFTEGRTNEAGEILQSIVKASGEDAQKTKATADWLMDFTQKYAITCREGARERGANPASQESPTEKQQDGNPWSSEVLYLDHERHSTH